MNRDEAAAVICDVLNRDLARYGSRPVTPTRVLAHPYALSTSAVEAIRDELTRVRRAHDVVNGRPDPTRWPPRRRAVLLNPDQLDVLRESGLWP